jgi:hypothetical protein
VPGLGVHDFSYTGQSCLTQASVSLDNHPRGWHAAALAAGWSKDGMGDGAQDMTEAIEIHFDKEEGCLRLDCGEEEFDRLRDLVVHGASAADRLGPFMDGIQSIVLRRRVAVRDETPGRFRGGFQAFIISLALAGALVIQVIGIVAIARWLLRLGS